MTAIVFLGPSLPAVDARELLPGVEVLPPVALGDVYRAARRRPLVIGIVDGFFEQRPAVFHKEILWALDQGISVVGSSSMGALRAAELHAFGMEGVGSVFRGFADGTMTADDEVAVAHASAADGFRPMSEPLVSIRATVARAEADDVVDATTATTVVAAAKALFYPDRIWPAILASAVASGAPAEEVTRLRDWLGGNAVDVKRLDALELLRRMGQIVDAGADRRVDFDFSNTTFWMDARHAVDATPEGSPDDSPDDSPDVVTSHDVTTDDVLEELRLDPSDYQLTVERARARYVALTLADHYGLRPELGAILEENLRLRRAMGLETPGAVADWQRANDVGGDELVRLLTEESQVRWVSTTADAAQRSYLVDYLRLTGRYGDLLRRSRAKRRVLRSAGLEFPSVDAAHLQDRDASAWMHDRLRTRWGRGMGAPVDDATITDESTTAPNLLALAEEVGLRDGQELQRALLREYLYTRECRDDADMSTGHS